MDVPFKACNCDKETKGTVNQVPTKFIEKRTLDVEQCVQGFVPEESLSETCICGREVPRVFVGGNIDGSADKTAVSNDKKECGFFKKVMENARSILSISKCKCEDTHTSSILNEEPTKDKEETCVCGTSSESDLKEDNSYSQDTSSNSCCCCRSPPSSSSDQKGESSSTYCELCMSAQAQASADKKQTISSTLCEPCISAQAQTSADKNQTISSTCCQRCISAQAQTSADKKQTISCTCEPYVSAQAQTSADKKQIISCTCCEACISAQTQATINDNTLQEISCTCCEPCWSAQVQTTLKEKPSSKSCGCATCLKTVSGGVQVSNKPQMADKLTTTKPNEKNMKFNFDVIAAPCWIKPDKPKNQFNFSKSSPDFVIKAPPTLKRKECIDPNCKPAKRFRSRSNIREENKVHPSVAKRSAGCFCKTSNSAQLMQMLTELAHQEKDIKNQLNNLIDREKNYECLLNNLQSNLSSKNPSCCCHRQRNQETSDFERISQELKCENRRLNADLMEMKLELRHCLEKVEGPMKAKLESERSKCINLQQELNQASQNMLISQEMYTREMNSLKMQLCCACSNMNELNNINQKLKEELASLDCMCMKLEEDLMKQKLSEADTIRRLKRRCKDEPGEGSPAQFDTIKKPKLESKTVSKDSFKCESNLHILARKLSETLKESEPCEECSKLPQELAGAARCIKDLTDMVERRKTCRGSKESMRKDSFSQSLPPMETVHCQCTEYRDKGAGENVVTAEVQYKGDNAPEKETKTTDVASEKFVEAQGDAAHRPGTPDGVVTLPDVPKDEIEIEEKFATPKSSKISTKYKSSACPSSCFIESVPCPRGEEFLKTLEAGTQKDLEKDKAKETKAQEAQVKLADEDGSAYKIARTATEDIIEQVGHEGERREKEKQEAQAKKVKETDPESYAIARTATEEIVNRVGAESETKLSETKKNTEEEQIKSIPEVAPAGDEGDKKVGEKDFSEEITPTEPSESDKQGVKESAIPVSEILQSPTSEAGDAIIVDEEEKGNFPFDVSTKAEALTEPPPGLNVTTVITTSGNLEIVTESPQGFIETTLNYNEAEGTIVVVTELSENVPEDTVGSSDQTGTSSKHISEELRKEMKQAVSEGETIPPTSSEISKRTETMPTEEEVTSSEPTTTTSKPSTNKKLSTEKSNIKKSDEISTSHSCPPTCYVDGKPCPRFVDTYKPSEVKRPPAEGESEDTEGEFTEIASEKESKPKGPIAAPSEVEKKPSPAIDNAIEGDKAKEEPGDAIEKQEKTTIVNAKSDEEVLVKVVDMEKLSKIDKKASLPPTESEKEPTEGGIGEDIKEVVTSEGETGKIAEIPTSEAQLKESKEVAEGEVEPEKGVEAPTSEIKSKTSEGKSKGSKEVAVGDAGPAADSELLTSEIESGISEAGPKGSKEVAVGDAGPAADSELLTSEIESGISEAEPKGSKEVAVGDAEPVGDSELPASEIEPGISEAGPKGSKEVAVGDAEPAADSEFLTSEIESGISEAGPKGNKEVAVGDAEPAADSEPPASEIEPGISEAGPKGSKEAAVGDAEPAESLTVPTTDTEAKASEIEQPEKDEKAVAGDAEPSKSAEVPVSETEAKSTEKVKKCCCVGDCTCSVCQVDDLKKRLDQCIQTEPRSAAESVESGICECKGRATEKKSGPYAAGVAESKPSKPEAEEIAEGKESQMTEATEGTKLAEPESKLTGDKSSDEELQSAKTTLSEGKTTPSEIEAMKSAQSQPSEVVKEAKTAESVSQTEAKKSIEKTPSKVEEKPSEAVTTRGPSETEAMKSAQSKPSEEVQEVKIAEGVSQTEAKKGIEKTPSQVEEKPTETEKKSSEPVTTRKLSETKETASGTEVVKSVEKRSSGTKETASETEAVRKGEETPDDNRETSSEPAATKIAEGTPSETKKVPSEAGVRKSAEKKPSETKGTENEPAIERVSPKASEGKPDETPSVYESSEDVGLKSLKEEKAEEAETPAVVHPEQPMTHQKYDCECQAQSMTDQSCQCCECKTVGTLTSPDQETTTEDIPTTEKMPPNAQTQSAPQQDSPTGDAEKTTVEISKEIPDEITDNAAAPTETEQPPRDKTEDENEPLSTITEKTETSESTHYTDAGTTSQPEERQLTKSEGDGPPQDAQEDPENFVSAQDIPIKSSEASKISSPKASTEDSKQEAKTKSSSEVPKSMSKTSGQKSSPKGSEAKRRSSSEVPDSVSKLSDKKSSPKGSEIVTMKDSKRRSSSEVPEVVSKLSDKQSPSPIRSETSDPKRPKKKRSPKFDSVSCECSTCHCIICAPDVIAKRIELTGSPKPPGGATDQICCCVGKIPNKPDCKQTCKPEFIAQSQQTPSTTEAFLRSTNLDTPSETKSKKRISIDDVFDAAARKTDNAPSCAAYTKKRVCPGCQPQECQIDCLPAPTSETQTETGEATNVDSPRLSPMERMSHPSNCECIDCKCFPIIEELAQTVEHPVVKDEKQIYTVQCSCINAQNAKKMLEKTRIPIATNSPKPPRITSRYTPNKCDCNDCKCAPCPDREKSGMKPTESQGTPAAAGSQPTSQGATDQSSKKSVPPVCDCQDCKCPNCLGKPQPPPQQQQQDQQPTPGVPATQSVRMKTKDCCCTGECTCPTCPADVIEALKKELDECKQQQAKKIEEAKGIASALSKPISEAGKSTSPTDHPEDCDCDVCACPKAPGKPMAEARSKPISEAASKPISEAASKPISEAASKPISEAGKSASPTDHPEDCDCDVCACPKAPGKPMAEARSKPISEAASKPISEAASKPISEAASKPISEAGKSASPTDHPEDCDCDACKCPGAPKPEVVKEMPGVPSVRQKPSEPAECDCKPSCMCGPCRDPKLAPPTGTAGTIGAPTGSRQLSKCDCKPTCPCGPCRYNSAPTSQPTSSAPQSAAASAPTDAPPPTDAPCDCPICACDPGAPTSQPTSSAPQSAAASPQTETTSPQTETTSPQTGTAPCDCPVCSCAPCADSSKQASKQQDKPEQRGGETGCTCVGQCVCPPKDEKPPPSHPEGCTCDICTCKSQDKESKAAPPPDVAPTKVEHPSDCICPECVCSETGFADAGVGDKANKEIHTDQPPECSCDICTCPEETVDAAVSPVAEKGTHSLDCTCPTCVCPDIPPTEGLPEKKSVEVHPATCICDTCLCVEEEKHEKGCCCPDCKCMDCYNMKEKGTHSIDCKCGDCKCTDCRFISATSPGDTPAAARTAAPTPGTPPAAVTTPATPPAAVTTPATTSTATAAINAANCTCQDCTCFYCYYKSDRKPHEKECKCSPCLCTDCSFKHEAGHVAAVSAQSPAVDTKPSSAVGGDINAVKNRSCHCIECKCDVCSDQKRAQPSTAPESTAPAAQEKEVAAVTDTTTRSCHCMTCNCSKCVDPKKKTAEPTSTSGVKTCKCLSCICFDCKQKKVAAGAAIDTKPSAKSTPAGDVGSASAPVGDTGAPSIAAAQSKKSNGMPNSCKCTTCSCSVCQPTKQATTFDPICKCEPNCNCDKCVGKSTAAGIPGTPSVPAGDTGKPLIATTSGKKPELKQSANFDNMCKCAPNCPCDICVKKSLTGGTDTRSAPAGVAGTPSAPTGDSRVTTATSKKSGGMSEFCKCVTCSCADCKTSKPNQGFEATCKCAPTCICDNCAFKETVIATVDATQSQAQPSPAAMQAVASQPPTIKSASSKPQPEATPIVQFQQQPSVQSAKPPAQPPTTESHYESDHPKTQFTDPPPFDAPKRLPCDCTKCTCVICQSVRHEQETKYRSAPATIGEAPPFEVPVRMPCTCVECKCYTCNKEGGKPPTTPMAVYHSQPQIPGQPSSKSMGSRPVSAPPAVRGACQCSNNTFVAQTAAGPAAPTASSGSPNKINCQCAICNCSEELVKLLYSPIAKQNNFNVKQSTKSVAVSEVNETQSVQQTSKSIKSKQSTRSEQSAKSGQTTAKSSKYSSKMSEGDTRVSDCPCTDWPCNEVELVDIAKLDDESLLKKIESNKKENCECREQIKELKRALNRIRCSCNEAEMKAIKSKPLVKQASAFGQTMSGLKLALSNLQEKCKAKDKMIEAMTGELKARTSSNTLEKLLNINQIEDAPDYDRGNDINMPGKPMDVIYSTAGAKETECAAALPVDAKASKVSEAQKLPKSRSRKICKCGRTHKDKTKQKTDLSGFEVTDIKRITQDSIIIKWKSPKSNLVTGYDVFVNGVVKSKVMSGGRTSAMVHSLDLSSTIQVTIYAVTKCGRCEPRQLLFMKSSEI